MVTRILPTIYTQNNLVFGYSNLDGLPLRLKVLSTLRKHKSENHLGLSISRKYDASITLS